MTPEEKHIARLAEQKAWRDANKDKVREMNRQYRTRQQSNRKCDCGEPATIYAASAWICEDCRRLQQRYEAERARRDICGYPSAMTVHVLHEA